MAFKFAVFVCLVAITSGALIPTQQLSYAAPNAKVVAPDEYDAYPRYSYAYDVQDTITGDSKSQQETRDGDVVQGSYSVVDPDGIKRTVEYTSDPQNGFNAVVHREPIRQVTNGAPIAKIQAAPVAYSAAPVLPAAPTYAVAPTYVSAPQYPSVQTYATAPRYINAAAPYGAVPAYAATPAVHATPIAKFTATPFSYSAPTYHR